MATPPDRDFRVESAIAPPGRSGIVRMTPGHEEGGERRRTRAVGGAFDELALIEAAAGVCVCFASWPFVGAIWHVMRRRALHWVAAEQAQEQEQQGHEEFLFICCRKRLHCRFVIVSVSTKKEEQQQKCSHLVKSYLLGQIEMVYVC